jgi:hypothetical protein
MLCKRTSKNQITIPKKIIDRFNNCEYFEVKAHNDRIVLIPVKLVSVGKDPLEAIRGKVASGGIFETDIEEAIQWARKK